MQIRFVFFHSLFMTLGAMLFMIPALIFLLDNYSIFQKIAYDTHPGLIKHLEREVIWLKFLIVAGIAGVAFLGFFLSYRMIKHLTNPLVRMESHMRKLLQGNWQLPSFEHDGSNFKDLALTYDYFYRSLRVNTDMELNLLKKLNVDPNNREAYAAWKSLMEIKQQRIGIKSETLNIANESDAGTGASGPLRRAS